MKDFQLRLNSPPRGIYFRGMTVTGTLLVVTDTPKDYKSIQVKLFGFAKVKLTDGGTESDQNSRNYSSSENYINKSKTVWGEAAPSGRDILPAGTYQFPFSFPLVGVNLPSSHDNRSGKIRYIVEA